jgi:hypothetical protein
LQQDGRTTSGTGFLVHESGLIVTCAHVLGNEPRPENILVVFALTGQVCSAKVLAQGWRPREAEDVAFLQLQGPVPAGVEALSLGQSHGTEGHSFLTFGFPDASPDEGLNGSGQIIGHTLVKGINILQIVSSQVTTGFSGAPLLDMVKQRVVGMVTAIQAPDRYGRLADTAYVLPTETLQAICTILKASEDVPYMGLSAFKEADARFFFGRHALVEELAQHLRVNPRFMAVVGSSGSGKSSVVMAGLLPRLGRGEVPGFENLRIISFRPGSDALAALKKSLQESGLPARNPWTDLPAYLEEKPGLRVVLFIDQFEELFALGRENDRKEFLEGLSQLLKLHE